VTAVVSTPRGYDYRRRPVRGLGTIVNVGTVVAGTGVGLVLGGRLPERVRDAAMSGLGLVVVAVGVQSFLVTHNAVFPIVSIVAGGIIGEALRIEGRLEGLGETIRRRVERPGEESRFVEGFVTASLTYCVGALTILGPLQDGISGDIQLLVVKAALDGIVSVVYAAAFGWGVGFSAVVVGVLQGTVTVVGAVLGDGFLSDRMIDELESTGGIMIMGIGLRLLELKRVPVGSYLPGLVLAPLLVGLFATT
jgi:uncharacterized membrane protein YqgA involved in biofilm formation